LNQAGYQPHASKTALLIEADSSSAQVATLERLEDGARFKVPVGPVVYDRLSGQRVRAADFSSVQAPGTYQLSSSGLVSASFEIGANVYEPVIDALLKSYRLQRCGVTLEDATGPFSHPACHLHRATVRGALATLDASGGWHDAGDYGRYVATTAVVIGRLLFVSATSLPALRARLLDEVRVGLDWLISVQQADGAFYRKVGGTQWPADLSPNDDVQPLWAYGPGTAETAKAVAALAQAARVFARDDAAYAQKCRRAAERGWGSLLLHPDFELDWVSTDDEGTGAYRASDYDREDSLKTDHDDRLWAAVELYLAGVTSPAISRWVVRAGSTPLTLFEWKDPSALALEELAFTSLPLPEGLREGCHRAIIERADTLLEAVGQTPYGLASQRFIWGSNKLVAEEGLVLALAYRLTKGIQYQRAAQVQIDYLLGRNPFGRSYVSGIGSRPVRHVNHIWGRTIGQSPPGLLVGGPNQNDPSGKTPLEWGIWSWVDDDRAYGSNEYAIDYNSALIGLLLQHTHSP
jgi:endoglucanase